MLIHQGHAIERQGRDFVVLPYRARFGSLKAAKAWIKDHVKAEKLQMGMARTTRRNGVRDPAVLKAVFLGGGAGSGKSYAAEHIFGIPDGFEYAMAGDTGLKLLNTDPDFERNLKALQYKVSKSGAPVAKFSPKNLWKLSPEELDALGRGGDVTVGSGRYERTFHIPAHEAPRAKAKRWYGKREEMWTKERLGLLLDGTAKNYEKIARKKAQLEALGYDTMMLFLNTSLPVALERNRKRGRRLPDSMVEATWRAAQKAKERYGGLFGKNYFEHDNTEYGPFPGPARKEMKSFVKRPISNPIGQRWVVEQLAGKATRGRARSCEPGESHQVIHPGESRTLKRLLGKNWRAITDEYQWDAYRKECKGAPMFTMMELEDSGWAPNDPMYENNPRRWRRNRDNIIDDLLGSVAEKALAQASRSGVPLTASGKALSSTGDAVAGGRALWVSAPRSSERLALALTVSATTQLTRRGYQCMVDDLYLLVRAGAQVRDARGWR